MTQALQFKPGDPLCQRPLQSRGRSCQIPHICWEINIKFSQCGSEAVSCTASFLTETMLICTQYLVVFKISDKIFPDIRNWGIERMILEWYWGARYWLKILKQWNQLKRALEIRLLSSEYGWKYHTVILRKFPWYRGTIIVYKHRPSDR